MSRYVEKPHGLTLGSGNWFFVIDRHGETPDKIRDGYRAIVAIRKYAFTSCTIANVFIETPAEQLIWRRRERIEMRTFGDITYPHSETYYTLSDFAVRWLNSEVGAIHDRWDTYTQAGMSDRTLFFKRRKDALAFCNMVNSVLEGIKIGRW